MISPVSIQKVLDIAAIEEVVGDYVRLKRRGSTFTGLCPFHNEKTPSFSVNAKDNYYHCFGCGKGGSPANFLMEIDGLSFPEAIRTLASRYNIEIDDDQNEEDYQSQKNLKDSLLGALKFANQHFQNNLQKSEMGRAKALSYLLSRNLREDIIQKFELGYSQDSWNDLLDAALKQQYDLATLFQASLIKKKEGKSEENKESYYDMYRDRIIFPIHNLTGKTVAFAGRVIGKSLDKKQPKYVNSTETEVYHKSEIVYGLHLAKKTIKDEDKCYITEGYMDVIRMHQHGIYNVIASSGTSLTQEQVRQIGRFTENVCVLFDGDEAGAAASLRGIDIILEAGLNVEVVPFPEGEDPDSLCDKLEENKFREFLKNNSLDFIDYISQVYIGKNKNPSPLDKAKVTRQILESIALMPDGLKRGFLVKRTSELMDTDEQSLIFEINKIRHRNNRKKGEPVDESIQTLEKESVKPKEVDKPRATPLLAQEKALIATLFRYGHLPASEEMCVAQFILNEIDENEMFFRNSEYANILQIIKQELTVKNIPDKHYYLNHETLSPLAAELLSDQNFISPHWEKHDIYVKEKEENYLFEVENNLYYFQIHYTEMAYEEALEEQKEISLELERVNQLDIEEDDKQTLIDETELALYAMMKYIIDIQEIRREMSERKGAVILKS